MTAPISSLIGIFRTLSEMQGESRADRLGGSVVVPTSGQNSAERRASAQERLRSKLRVEKAQAAWSPARALRILVETALLQEFGESLQLDAAFHDLVERTSSAIEQSDEGRQLLQEAFIQMTSLADAPSIEP